MFRTIFSVGILAILGLFALKIALVGAVIYLIIRVVSPDTARRLREKFNG
jgi:hypothetical protein